MAQLRLAVVLFPGFEPLDVAGPVELFGNVPGISIIYVARAAGPVSSKVGAMTLVASHAFDELDPADGSTNSIDWLLVPGGIGARHEVGNAALLGFLHTWASRVHLCMSVCTGAALLAAAGVLDGRRATSNKAAFQWVVAQGPHVQWVRSARWVKDGSFVTSSGVSAGMDMALGVIASEFGEDEADRVSKYAEYEWHKDAAWDPFSELYLPSVDAAGCACTD